MDEYTKHNIKKTIAKKIKKISVMIKLKKKDYTIKIMQIKIFMFWAQVSISSVRWTETQLLGDTAFSTESVS